MPATFVLFSRLFAVICAPVVLIIMCSHAAKASPAAPIGQQGVKYSIPRRLNTVQQVSSSAGLPFQGSEVQAPGGSLSISNQQSHPVQFTQGSFSYIQNGLDKTRPRVTITKVQRGGMRPASNVFTSHSLYEGQSFDGSRIPVSALPQTERNIGNLYNPSINRVKYPKKTAGEREIWTSGSSRADKDASARKSYSVFPSQTGRLQSEKPVAPAGYGSDFMETNQLPAVGVRGGAAGMQPRKALDSTGQAWGRAESLGDGLSVIKRNPSHEKLTSISNFQKHPNSVSSGETPEHKRIHSYLFKESPAQVYAETRPVGRDVVRGQGDAASLAQKQSLTGAQENSRYASNFNHFTRTDANKREPQAQIGFSRPRVIIYPTPNKAVTPPPGFPHPAPAEDDKSLVSVAHSHSQDGRKTFAPLDRANETPVKLTQDYKPRPSIKRFHRVDELTNSERKPVKETSGLFSTEGTRPSLDEGKNGRFRFSYAYPHLSQKYSFGQKRAPAFANTLAKPGRVETSSPSPVTPVSSASTAPPIKGTLQSPRNATDTRFRLYKGRFGLKGYGSQPLEGAKALPESADASVAHRPRFKGFELRSSEISRPKRIRIHRLSKQGGETGPEGGESSSTREPSAARGDGSVRSFTTNHTTNKVRTLQGFQASRNRTTLALSRTSWTYPDQNPLRLSKIASSSFISSAGHLGDHLSAPPGPRAAGGNRPAVPVGPRFKSPTSSTVRGKRVNQTQAGTRKLVGPLARNATLNAAIHRPPRVKAVTYADILGSASFSSVRAAGRRTGPFANATAGQEHGWSSESDEAKKNTSRSPEAGVNGDEDGGRVERKEDNEVAMPDLFFESEGSGGLDLSDVLSAATEGEQAGSDLLELEYLRKSTGNMSFKSLSKSHVERR
ncbi:uncharacterized protein LOC105934637 isoform X2 [Fundulus heteroclitus]|uniref:uncharacterized protein LOC105934637 isoform X2 n=1 Tax=Fundulus heteroclitus TaxID=8078 RepID=UPI00165CC0DB|nr:uncharacterized protein LOC105934637 isoform X2 [Fundulus heteroclitus]